MVVKLKARGVTLRIEIQGSRWQTWLKDIDQVTLSPKPPSS
ncbi:Queuosine Biosynthesis QueE Radical SAM [Streptococcus lutetiensis]|nr:Queuosine Biosynthesis QueE Radical SAM [Streptococcus lutetiensis]